MENRTFSDSPLAQDYLFYLQDQLQKGVPLSEMTTPDAYYLAHSGGDPREDKLMRLESTDPRLTAIRRIYDLLGQKGTR